MRLAIVRKSAPLLLSLLCVVAAGCAPDDFANTNSNDPLYGATPPPPPRASAGLYAQPTGNVPPLPSSNPSPTLTGLTTSTPRIPTDPSAPGWQAPGTTAPVVLQPPQPITTPPAPPASPKVSDVQLTGNVTAAPDANALMAQLDAKTLGWRVSKTAQGLVLSFIFMVDKDQQHGEVPIVGGNYVSAMQAALAKINPTKN